MNYIIVILLALCFILFFSVQKLVFPNWYFTYSDPFIRNESISLKKYFYRIVVVIFFNVFFYLLLNLFYTSGEITTMLLSSNFLGVFLILWPLIFKPSQNLERNLSKKSIALLYSMYFTFLISTLVISILTINILKLYLNNINIITVFTSNKEGILFEILTIPFISVIDALVTKKYTDLENEDYNNINRVQCNSNGVHEYENVDGNMESDIEDIEEEGESSTNFNIYQYKNSEYRILFISIMNLALALFDVIERKKDKDNFKNE
ncbi:hypothetical protein FH179_02260 [Staphylococcus haemolyticus]|uniref:hypothetical protein n=1 Tax=Staphylococcus haemolyticus TaxID=1283 RepID=UPI001F5837C4|nr:hypothetical protein [Staphylococcus haemolyticus]MCI2933440.1 hypothetical protein [Staphylococcus haemolyticus]